MINMLPKVQLTKSALLLKYKSSSESVSPSTSYLKQRPTKRNRGHILDSTLLLEHETNGMAVYQETQTEQAATFGLKCIDPSFKAPCADRLYTQWEGKENRTS